MTILDMQQNGVYKIKSVHCGQGDLANRLQTMGIYAGAEVRQGHTSVWRHTYSVYVNGAQIALRKSEAELIEIEQA